VNNDTGVGFYKKFGFEIVEVIQNYYKTIQPPDCYLVQKVLKPVSTPSS